MLVPSAFTLNTTVLPLAIACAAGWRTIVGNATPAAELIDSVAESLEIEPKAFVTVTL
jgi:hypothetical protein